MAALKVGDKVVMRGGLKVGCEYQGKRLLPEMVFIGVKEIINIFDTAYLGYMLDGNLYLYAPSMIRKATKEELGISTYSKKIKKDMCILGRCIEDLFLNREPDIKKLSEASEVLKSYDMNLDARVIDKIIGW